MDWPLIVFVVVIIYFGYRGFRHGFMKSVARILSLVAGYAAAILFAGDVSEIVEAQVQLQGIAAFVTASLILFVGAGFVVNLFFWLLQKAFFSETRISTASALGGAAVGSLVGLLLALVVVWTVGLVRDLRPAEIVAGGQLPDGGLAAGSGLVPNRVSALDATAKAPASKIEKLANQVASKAVGSAMSLGDASPEVVNLSSALMASPAEVTQQAKRVMDSKALAELLRDPANQAVLNSGDYQAVAGLPAFQKLVRDPDLQALARSTGMLEAGGADNQAVADELAVQLTDIWGRVQRVKNHPRVQEIIVDAEFQQKIQSGNPMDLLTNAKLLELANIVFADDLPPAEGNYPGAAQIPTGQSAGDVAPQQPAVQKKKPKKQLYRWTDKDGRIYYSDVKPES